MGKKLASELDPRADRAGHPHVDQPVAHNAVRGGDEDPVAGLFGCQVATVGFLHAVPPIG